MKKLACVLLGLVMVVAAGMAYAGEARVPQELQAQFEQQTGAKAAYWLWFPVVAEYPKDLNWTNFLILSNYTSGNIEIGCWFTSFGKKQTFNTYKLVGYEKLILAVGQEVTANQGYDILCGSNNFFGGAVLLFEGGSLATSMPWTYF